MVSFIFSLTARASFSIASALTASDKSALPRLFKLCIQFGGQLKQPSVSADIWRLRSALAAANSCLLRLDRMHFQPPADVRHPGSPAISVGVFLGMVALVDLVDISAALGQAGRRHQREGKRARPQRAPSLKRSAPRARTPFRDSGSSPCSPADLLLRRYRQLHFLLHNSRQLLNRLRFVNRILATCLSDLSTSAFRAIAMVSSISLASTNSFRRSALAALKLRCNPRLFPHHHLLVGIGKTIGLRRDQWPRRSRRRLGYLGKAGNRQCAADDCTANQHPENCAPPLIMS